MDGEPRYENIPINFKKENADNEKTDDISVIGQFGVGFYSSFMVADKVEVISKAFGENVAHKWVSTGADGYTIEECEKENAGSEITLYVKEDTTIITMSSSTNTE